MDVSEKLRS